MGDSPIWGAGQINAKHDRLAAAKNFGQILGAFEGAPVGQQALVVGRIARALIQVVQAKSACLLLLGIG